MEWNDIVLTDESRFCLQHHYDRIRVWRHRGKRLLNCCIMYSHTDPAPDVMVWGGFGFHCHAPLERIAALNHQRYISEVLKPLVYPCIHSSVAIQSYSNEIMRATTCDTHYSKFFFSHQIEFFHWPACSPGL
ncbi:transposable element Tcb1 transposase [Trichonephila clavipes]|nr:transposable element Tcb1 transposase [Trichonephila clavipes]